MSDPIQILIVDDQPRARQSLKALLATWPMIGEVREAANGVEAIEAIERCQPDLVLMDMRMPVMDGIEATRRIKARWPQIKIMALSMYGDAEGEALLAGADAFVCKGEPPEKLLATVAAAVN